MSPTRRLAELPILALALLVAGGCAAFDPYRLITRHAGAGTADGPVPEVAGLPLGEARRREALDFVWRTVDERYYDAKFNGIDWAAARARWEPAALAAPTDEAFWADLDRMTGELGDAHTRVVSPADAARLSRDEALTLGFSLAPLEGRLAVTGVRPDGDAYFAGVRTGMTLEAVDGRPAMAAWEDALARARGNSTPRARVRSAIRHLLLDGAPGSKVRLRFARAGGEALEATLARTEVPARPAVTHRVLPSGHGYLRLTAWSQPLEGATIAAIEALAGTPGLVIDLRGNPGGSALMVRHVAARFFPKGETVKLGRAITRTGRPITLAFGLFEVLKVEQSLEGTGTYAGPVAVLVNESSASASELFAAILQSQGRARVVGRTSCGCLLAFMGYAAVPGGGKLAYSEVGFALPDGRRIEHEGVVPDEPVPLTLADLRADRDRALEAAQAWLASQARARGGNRG